MSILKGSVVWLQCNYLIWFFLPLLHPTLPNADDPVATELKANPISKSTGQDVVFPTASFVNFLVCGFVLLCSWAVDEVLLKLIMFLDWMIATVFCADNTFIVFTWTVYLEAGAFCYACNSLLWIWVWITMSILCEYYRTSIHLFELAGDRLIELALLHLCFLC